MKYLVTGGAGFIGSHLVETLVHGGHFVRLLDNFSTGRHENLEGVQFSNLEIVEGDIRDVDLLSHCVKGVDGIFHQGGLVSVQDSIERPDLSADINARGSVNVLQAARAAGVKRVILASSAAVYGNSLNFPTSEDESPQPLSPYGLDKLYAEKAGELYHSLFNMQVVVLRYFNVYGPRQRSDSPYSGVVSLFIDAVSGGRPVTIYGDGEQSRDFVHVHDVVQANMLAMQAPFVGYHVLNVGGGVSVSLKELLRLVWEVAGRITNVSYVPSRPKDIRHSHADISLAKMRLGYKPRWALREGLGTMMAAPHSPVLSAGGLRPNDEFA